MHGPAAAQVDSATVRIVATRLLTLASTSFRDRIGCLPVPPHFWTALGVHLEAS